ncbi:MAG: phosphoglucosamine mutase [PVC group bacterium]|nr:phosphoglucosamine mutase [PVC group bacterium]
MKRLFGTDGIRGKFKEWPLTTDVIYNVSLATGIWLKKKHKRKRPLRVIIGKDTRYSCDAIEKYLAAGFTQKGIEVYSAGVLPTPGLAYLANTMDVELGIMISASHNPADDNGIKFFKHNGYKLTEIEECQIEKIIFALLDKKSKAKKQGRIKLKKISAEPYMEHLKQCVAGLDLKGKKVVIDCANGAVSDYAGRLLKDFGAKVTALSAKPDGRNINRNCGSLHPERAADQIKRKGACVGFSFDGDGDRVIYSNEKGVVCDGDQIMTLVARHFMKKKKLASKTVVATSMSNFGLGKILDKLKVKLIRADVGDKYVLEQILKNKANFGGEQSGHIIFLDYATTGDGMLTALQILQIMQETGTAASRLATGYKRYPQLLINIRVKEKKDFKKIPSVWEKAQEVEKTLKGDGRLVLRYSGTEPLARVMVEGKCKRQIKKLAYSIIDEIKKEIG